MSNVFTSKTPKFSNFTREKHVNRDIFGKNMRMEDVLLIYFKQIAKDCLFTGQEQACNGSPLCWLFVCSFVCLFVTMPRMDEHNVLMILMLMAT